MRKSYRAQRDAVIDTILQSPLGARCRVSGEDAGLHFLLTIDTKCTDHVLRADAEGRGVRLAFLSDFALSTGSAPQPPLVIRDPRMARRCPFWRRCCISATGNTRAENELRVNISIIR